MIGQSHQTSGEDLNKVTLALPQFLFFVHAKSLPKHNMAYLVLNSFYHSMGVDSQKPIKILLAL